MMKAYSCSKRAADPTNEAATCTRWCGNADTCWCVEIDESLAATPELHRYLRGDGPKPLKNTLPEFLAALNGQNGELDTWLENNNEAEVRAHVLALVNAERDECAGICDRFAARDMPPAECAGAIRMRSNTIKAPGRPLE